jgi:hypothetical protein
VVLGLEPFRRGSAPVIALTVLMGTSARGLLSRSAKGLELLVM